MGRTKTAKRIHPFLLFGERTGKRINRMIEEIARGA
jgi:hypothetical protein